MAENIDKLSAHFIHDLQSDGGETEPSFCNKDVGETDDCLKPMREEWMAKEPLISEDAQNICQLEIIAENGKTLNRSCEAIEVENKT